uniref:Uncharacterized protein n=1 Tax=viral metagenome TaxID=1070528 RepID=A0A6C0EB27_9ZZZZ
MEPYYKIGCNPKTKKADDTKYTGEQIMKMDVQDVEYVMKFYTPLVNEEQREEIDIVLYDSFFEYVTDYSYNYSSLKNIYGTNALDPIDIEIIKKFNGNS